MPPFLRLVWYFIPSAALLFAYFSLLFLSFGLIPLMLALALAVFLFFYYHYCFGFLAFPHFSLPQPAFLGFLPAFSLLLLAWHVLTLSYSNCYSFLVYPCLLVVFAALSQACLVFHSFCCFVVCLLFFAFPFLWFNSSHACSCSCCVFGFSLLFWLSCFSSLFLASVLFLGFACFFFVVACLACFYLVIF